MISFRFRTFTCFSLALILILSKAQRLEETPVTTPDMIPATSINPRPSPLNRTIALQIRDRSVELIAENQIASLLGINLITRIQRRIARFSGCPQLICFGIDGSGSITRTEFEIQQSFVSLVAALMSVDELAQFSAVQYGLRNILISDFTANEDLFERRVNSSIHARAPRTFLAAGLGFCVRDLRGNPAPQQRNIVILGDGSSNFGTEDLSSIVAQANATIYAVGVGFSDDSKLLQLTQGMDSRLFALADYSMMAAAAFNLVREVCNVNIPPL